MDLSTSVLGDPAGATIAGAPVPAPMHRVRIGLAVVGLVVVVSGLALGAPVALLAGLTLSVTSLARRWLPLDLAVPAAALSCVGGALVVGLLADAGDVDLLSSPTVLTLVFLLAAGLAAADAVRRPAAIRGERTRGAWVAYLPALLAAAIAWVQAATAWTATSWAFVGTDLAQHMLALQDVQGSGRLDYATNGYPRALHMLLALGSGPSAPVDDPAALLPYDLRLMAAATWLAFALMLATAATVALRLGRLRGARDTYAVCGAALGTAALLLLNPLVLSFVYMGAAASLLALVVLWSLPLAALELDRRRMARPATTLIVVAALGVALLANLWQALVIVPVVALTTVAVVRRPWRLLGTPSPAQVLAALGLVVVTLALSAPPMLAVLRASGLATAAIAGTIDPVPLPLLTSGLVCLGVLARRWAATSTRAFVGSAAGLAVMAVLVLRGSGHVDLSQYYVVKALWFLTVLLVPVASAVGVPAVLRLCAVPWRWLDRLGARARLARTVVVATSAALVVGFVLPYEATVGSSAWDTVTTQEASTTSARAYTTAADYGLRYAPAVVVPVELGSGSLPDPLTTKIASKLLNFLTGQPLTLGLPLEVCADVRAVAGRGPAVVVTTLDPEVLTPVMRVGGCSDVPVVRVAGPRRALGFPLDASKAAVAP